MGSIEKIHEMLVSKECSCTELTKSYLDEIEKADGELNAYVNVTGEEALKTAEAVDRKIASGEEIGMLEGVPMTLKDNISTKGIETTCCSKILTGYKPIYNATVWETLAGENAVMLGKTNMDEFAMGSSCETSYFGGAMNPFDSNYVSGGSSGGVASAVGANIAAYGLGSDTGGSIRQPASFCGIVGLKPTYGAVSRYGLIAYASSLDQIGPITKSVEDAAIVFDAISKRDEKDSTSNGFVGDTYSKLNNDIKGMKIGIAKEYLEGVRDDVKEAVLKAADIYKSMGAEIVYFDLPELNLPFLFTISSPVPRHLQTSADMTVSVSVTKPSITTALTIWSAVPVRRDSAKRLNAESSSVLMFFPQVTMTLITKRLRIFAVLSLRHSTTHLKSAM